MTTIVVYTYDIPNESVDRHLLTNILTLLRDIINSSGANYIFSADTVRNFSREMISNIPSDATVVVHEDNYPSSYWMNTTQMFNARYLVKVLPLSYYFPYQIIESRQFLLSNNFLYGLSSIRQSFSENNASNIFRHWYNIIVNSNRILGLYNQGLIGEPSINETGVQYLLDIQLTLTCVIISKTNLFEISEITQGMDTDWRDIDQLILEQKLYFEDGGNGNFDNPTIPFLRVMPIIYSSARRIHTNDTLISEEETFESFQDISPQGLTSRGSPPPQPFQSSYSDNPSPQNFGLLTPVSQDKVRIYISTGKLLSDKSLEDHEWEEVENVIEKARTHTSLRNKFQERFCPIKYETADDVSTCLSCGEIFERELLYQWIQRGIYCPSCKAESPAIHDITANAVQRCDLSILNIVNILKPDCVIYQSQKFYDQFPNSYKNLFNFQNIRDFNDWNNCIEIAVIDSGMASISSLLRNIPEYKKSVIRISLIY